MRPKRNVDPHSASIAHISKGCVEGHTGCDNTFPDGGPEELLGGQHLAWATALMKYSANLALKETISFNQTEGFQLAALDPLY